MVSEERIKTNHMLLTELDMWDEFSVKSINDEWTLRYYNHLMNLLNSQVDEAIKWLDSDDAKELFFEEAEYQYELFRSLEDEWDDILEQKYPSVEALLDEVYRRGKAKGYADMREHIRFTDTDKLALNIVRDYNFHLIRKIDNDTRNQIKNIITSAVLTGENPRKVAPKIYDVVGERLEGSTFTPMQRAVMIARTEVSRVQNTGILQSYVNEGYTEVKILTAEDNNVCYTCLTYAYEFNEESEIIFSNHGEEKVHNIIELLQGGKFPPFHPNCRCTYLSIWRSKEEPPEEPIIIDLTSENYLYEKVVARFRDNGVISNLKGFNDDLWTKKGIKKSLDGFVDADDLDDVSKAIFDFIQNAKEYTSEGITTHDENFNSISEFIPSDSERFIDVPDEDIDEVEGSYFGLVGHSHTKSKIPLPNWYDIETGILNLDIKYNVIYAPGFGVVVIKNKNIDYEINITKSDLKDAYDNAHEKRNTYVNNNITRVKDDYKRSVKGKYISYVKQHRDLKKIEENVRHSNLKDQCDFYNDELKHYGIELTYISP